MIDKNGTFVLLTYFKEHESIPTDKTTVYYAERYRKAGFANRALIKPIAVSAKR